jgi:hypothetical protein
MVFDHVQSQGCAAPVVILEACGAVADIVGSEKWHSKLLQHQRLIEDAVGFKSKEAV